MTILNNKLNSTVYCSLMILGWAFFAVYAPFCGHALMPWLSSSSGAVVVLVLLVWWSEGIKPPSSWWQGSLFNWVGLLCIRVEDVNSSWILTWRGTYPLHPPFLVLQTVTQFHEYLCQSWDSPSDGIYGQRCHSLGQMYVFLQMSTPTAHYLESSPIISGCSGRCPW